MSLVIFFFDSISCFLLSYAVDIGYQPRALLLQYNVLILVCCVICRAICSLVLLELVDIR